MKLKSLILSTSLAAILSVYGGEINAQATTNAQVPAAPPPPPATTPMQNSSMGVPGARPMMQQNTTAITTPGTLGTIAQGQASVMLDQNIVQQAVGAIQQTITAIDSFQMQNGTDDLRDKRRTLADAIEVLMTLKSDMEEEAQTQKALKNAQMNQQMQASAKQKYNALVTQLGQIISEINRLTESAGTEGITSSQVTAAQQGPAAQYQAQRNQLKPTQTQPSFTGPAPNQGSFAQQLQTQKGQLNPTQQQAPVTGTTIQPGTQQQNWNQMSVKQRAAALQGMKVPQAPAQ